MASFHRNPLSLADRTKEIKHDKPKQTSVDAYMNDTGSDNTLASVIMVLFYAFRRNKCSSFRCYHTSTSTAIVVKYYNSFRCHLIFLLQPFPVCDRKNTCARGGATVKCCCSLKNLLMKSCSARHKGSSSLRTCSNICRDKNK